MQCSQTGELLTIRWTGHFENNYKGKNSKENIGDTGASERTCVPDIRRFTNIKYYYYYYL